MAWLERVDLADRAVWVSTFKDGEDTIGKVIKQTRDGRGASKCKAKQGGPEGAWSKVTPSSGETTNHHRGNIGNDGRTGGISQPILGQACEVSASRHPRLPLMIDNMFGPNSPLTKGLITERWYTLPIDQEDLVGRVHRPACIGPPLREKDM